MICERLRDEIFLFAADELEGDARAEVARHLDSGCPTCIGALASARAALARLSLLLEPQAPPSALRRQILAGVVTAESAAPEATTSAPPRRRLWRASLASAAGLVVGIALAGSYQASRIQGLESELAAALSERDRLDLARNTTLAALDITGSGDVKTIALAGSALGFSGKATLYWEWRTGECLLRASKLGLDPGQRLALWFSDIDGEPLAGGEFVVTADAGAMFLTQLPHSIDVYGPVYITLVADAGAPRPVGEHQLGGALDG